MIIAILVIFGLALGSFVNALVWRLHEQEQRAKGKGQSKKKDSKLSPQSSALSPSNLSILRGRSMCPECRHGLPIKDLIPVLSWLSLRGKCRYCSKPISWQYPVVELTTSALFVASYIWWPIEFNNFGLTNFAVWLVCLVGFVALTVYDFRWLTLPNRIVYPLIVLAAAMVIANVTVFEGGFELVRDTLVSIAIASGLFYGLFNLSKGKWIGGGDVKLGLLIGLLIADGVSAFLVLFIASLIGTITIIPGMISRKLNTNSQVPFGPFLIVATVIVKLFGASLITWYKHQFLLA